MGNPVRSFIWNELMTTEAGRVAGFCRAVIGWAFAPPPSRPQPGAPFGVTEPLGN